MILPALRRDEQTVFPPSAKARKKGQKMDRTMFARNLLKRVSRRLPQSNNSEYSYRYNTMVRSEDAAPFEKIAVVIDAALNPSDVKYIIDTLTDIFKKDRTFRYSNYGLVIWQDGELQLGNLRPLKRLPLLLEQRQLSQAASGGLSNLIDISNNLCKSVGLTVFITDIEKMQSTSATHFPYENKSVVVYPDRSNSTDPERVLGAYCFGLDMPAPTQNTGA